MLGRLGTLLGQVLEHRQQQQKRQLNTELVSCPGLAASQGWAAWCPVSALCQELEWEAQQRQQLQRRQRRRQEPMVQGCCPGPVVSQVLCPVLALCLAWFLVLEVSPGWQESGHQQEQQQQQPRQLSTVSTAPLKEPLATSLSWGICSVPCRQLLQHSSLPQEVT